MISKSVKGEQYVMVSKSVMGEKYVKETGGTMGLKRVNGGQSNEDVMISKSVMDEQYVMVSKCRRLGESIRLISFTATPPNVSVRAGCTCAMVKPSHASSAPSSTHTPSTGLGLKRRNQNATINTDKTRRRQMRSVKQL